LEYSKQETARETFRADSAISRRW